MASSKVNMSLDDIIKQNKKGRVQDRNRNRGGFNNKRRNFGERRGYASKNEENKISNVTEEKRTRLFVSNLQKEIVNSELRVNINL